MALTLWPLANSRVPAAQKAVVAIYGPCLSGLIVNPATARDQNLGTVETLYIDLINTALVAETATCWPIQPGQSFTIPAGFAGNVSINAASAGHAFAGYVIQQASDFVPLEGAGEGEQPFPPDIPSVLRTTVGSYLYQQYTDDDDLQAFVAAFNEMLGWYVEWFALLNPADYTQQHIQSTLLDWVAAGLYGMTRPALPLGHSVAIGPLNTFAFNTWVLNAYRVIPPADYQLTTDDIFKRILTWHLYKDDGEVFTIRWLKRRVERFLTGVNGTGGDTHSTDHWQGPDETYEVSVTFGVGNEVNINFSRARLRFISGALMNGFALNTAYFNKFKAESISIPMTPLAPIFKAAVDSGALELPFQFKFIVNIN